MVYVNGESLEPPKQASAWRSEPCYSLSWQVADTWHYIAGDCVEKKPQSLRHLPPMKEHAYFGLNMVLSGQGTYVDWHGQRHQLSPGVVFQRIPEKSHCVEIDADCRWSEVYLSIRKRTVRHLFDLGLVHNCPVFYVRHPELILKQFRDILLALSQANTAHVPAILVQIQNILITIHDNAEKESDPDPYRLLIADACALLDCNLAQELDMESIAIEVGMAYETFRKAFKQRRGISPGAYRVRKRLERSCILLRTTAIPIQDIAESLGYSDGFSYSAQFKKTLGMSPTAYRS